MTQYIISFDEGAMTFPMSELADVAVAAHAVVKEAQEAGVWVFGAGVTDHEEASTVSPTGEIKNGGHIANKQYLGGFAVIDVANRDEAVKWAAKIATSCRCSQEVRELLYDPEM
jgi:hypothetical protein